MAEQDTMEDEEITGGSDNFYGLGGYKKTLKRISTGAKLCDELQKLFEERASIEKSYAKALNGWVDKWRERVEKLGESGTLLSGWHHVLIEARSVADIHNTMREQLEGPLIVEIEEWRKMHLPRTLMGSKSFKRATQAFQKAQEPWSQKKQKVEKYQKILISHSSAAQNVKNIMATKPGIDTKKYEAMLAKEENDAREAKAELDRKIKDMSDYSDIYRREMKLEFDRCQGEEGDRIKFFKKMFEKYLEETNVVPEFDRSHSNLKNGLSNIDADQDVAVFSKLYGADMTFELPIEDIGSLSRQTSTQSSGGTLRGKPAGLGEHDKPASDYVEALYEYKAAKSDELSFNEGEVLEILRDKPTDPGWLRGKRTNGDVGLFPGNYVKYK